MRQRVGLAGLAALLPNAAWAHAFASGRDVYGNFLDGARVLLASPGLVLPVFALALALALWKPEGLLAAWPHFLVGSLAGLAAAPFAGAWVGLMPLGVGMVVAVLAALVALPRIAPALPWLAALTGLATLAAALQGHGFAEVALATRIGLLFGANFALAGFAGLVQLTRDRVAHPVTTILWRVVASWFAAILVLYLAFTLKG